MLDLLARHGRLDLTVTANGDLETGAHHTVEDVGICIGQALDEALGDRAGIVRYGHATLPMDEARASCAIDISGRGLLAFSAPLAPGAIGNFDHELVEEFFRAFAANAKLTLHVTVEAGTNAHHIIEAMFKALARALLGWRWPSTRPRPVFRARRGRLYEPGHSDRDRRLRDGQPPLGAEGV